MPSNNIGILRTRLDAISGDPNLYLRVGNPPTLSHYQNGDYGNAMSERSLTANVGSEYGNWVPLSGRDELQLTPGTWYLAVQAGGNSNVRYRLLSSLGVVTDLTYNGVTLVNQTLAAGDWRYYRVFVPTNAFTSWNVTFAQTLGDVVMYVRDITPPGQGSTVGDYRHWQPDNKNFGPYPIVDPQGTTSLPCPPLRPGSYYYLGFRAVNDATFSVSSTTNITTINYTNTIAFYNGGVTNVIPANGVLKYRIDVPADARRWIHTSTHSNTVWLYLEQGTIPNPPSEYQWTSSGAANSSLNQQLYGSSWPWFPAYSYFLLITNTTALPQNFVFNMNGRNSATDDFDGDGLPDSWELTYWPSIYSYNGNGEPDGDGVNNMEEYLEGTNPTNFASFNPRLLVTANNGIVTRNPVGNNTLTPPKLSYPLNASVQLTATANPGYSFIYWSGDAAGSANPLTVLMTTNKNITANFGITNNSGADYQFQLNLASSAGSPPNLQDIGVGNSYATEPVDTCSRIVRQFPLHNGLHLQPTAGVIPTNIYTIVMLFRLDQTNGYRRLIDFKAGANNGLYSYNGRLYFYPSALAPASTIAASNYVQVVLTRDGTNVVGYVNGTPQFSFTDSAEYGVLTSANDLRFFKDDGTTEESGGAVARIRLYAAAMTASQIAVLDRTDCAGVPHFLTPWFDALNVLNLPVEHVIPGIAYRLQASTNLSTWTSIVTNTPIADPALFTDPKATNYPNRMYRLVTP